MSGWVQNENEIGDMITENSEEDEELAKDEVRKSPQIVLETGETVSVSEDTPISKIPNLPGG